MAAARLLAWIGLAGTIPLAAWPQPAPPAAPPQASQGVHRFAAVAISPDGSRVASIETGQPAIGGAPSATRLLIRYVTGGRVTAVPLPCEEGCLASSPVWAPDGKHLAFSVTSARNRTRSIYVSDSDGTDSKQVLAFNGTLKALRYAPNGRLAALAIKGATADVGAARATAGQTGEIGEDVREQRIGVVADGELRWASPPDLYVHEYDWLPDGSGFVGTAAPGDGNANWWRSRLYAFDTADASARIIYAPTDPLQQIAFPKVAPDGHAVAFIGGLMSDFENPGGDAFVLSLETPGKAARPRNVTDNVAATVTTLAWGCAPGRLVASLTRGAATEIADIEAASGDLRVLWSRELVLNGADTAVSQSCAARITATIREGFTTPPEIAVGPLGAWRDLTALNAAITTPIRVRSIDWTSDGHAVQGWLMTSATADPAARLPMITQVHGGPAASHQPYFYGPGSQRALVEHGYALFLPNPRGSYGQGEAFTRANVRDFGHGDLRDIMAGIDEVLRVAPIDESRLGIAGASYGGYMAMWATTQTHRFKAAMARAGISNWQSYYGENGISDWLLPYFGASVYDDPAVYARSSPINFIKNVRTPTLIVVGEQDIECPPPQSMEFWHALHELGTPTSLVIYAGEGHDYWNGTSTADYQRRERDWFDKYLR